MGRPNTTRIERPKIHLPDARFLFRATRLENTVECGAVDIRGRTVTYTGYNG